MIHGNIIKLSIYANSETVIKAGMPVAIKNNNGKSELVPYSATNNKFIGIAVEDSVNYGAEVEGNRNYVPSISYDGINDCLAGEALVAGDIVVPSETGFKKSLDENGVGIVIKGAKKANDWATIILK